MATERKTFPFAAKLVENKENREIKSLKEDRTMKTIPQCISKVCPSSSTSQTKDGKSSIRPIVSTKSPITGRPLKPAKRKGLATLQQSGSNKSVIVGTPKSKVLSQRESKLNKFEIFCEETSKVETTVSQPKVVCESIATQTDFEEWLSLEETKGPDSLAEEALALMRSEPSKEEYFKEIAEQRRLALEEALQENEELYDELEKVNEKNSILEKALSEAESYKLLYLAMVEKTEGETCA